MQYTQKFQKREKKMKEFESLKTVLNKKVLTVVFNRPNEMNTFSGQMLKDILELLDEAEKDDDIRAVIFTGSGKAFCAGADLSSGEDTFDMSDKGKSDAEVKRDTGGILTLRLFDFKKPLIAAINGAAVGVGVTMTLPMDVRICSEKAKFGFVFAKRGIVPEACSSWFLPKIVGISNALQWCLSGKIFIQSCPSLFMYLVAAIRAASICLEVINTEPRALIPNIPLESWFPRDESPFIFPF